MFISTTKNPTMTCLLSSYDSVWIIKNYINIQKQSTLANGIFLFSISPFKLINELMSEKKQYQTSVDWSEVTLVPFSINVSISYALHTIEWWLCVLRLFHRWNKGLRTWCWAGSILCSFTDSPCLLKWATKGGSYLKFTYLEKWCGA